MICLNAPYARAAAVRKFLIGAAVLLCHLGVIAGSAGSAEIMTFMPQSGPAVILVRGELAVTDGIRFARKTDAIEEAIVRFESPGGMLIAGLGIGRTIRRKGYSTVVPAAAQCASACALAWLAGAERFMAKNARIGFHTAYLANNGRPRKSRAAQAAVVDYLEQLELPKRAIDYFTSSPPQGLYVLTMSRARTLGVAVSPYGPDDITGSVDVMPARAAPTITRLPEVDLFGLNLPEMPIKAGSTDDCEARCTAKADCAAFTFNTARSACYLKASAEIAVTHPAAISGFRDRPSKRIRRVDMTIQEATDYPGNDIDRRKATSFEACLLTCGKTRTCKAFTYVVRRHECWLKNGIGSAEPHDGLVSGVK
jgi:hypothetical protein